MGKWLLKVGIYGLCCFLFFFLYIFCYQALPDACFFGFFQVQRMTKELKKKKGVILLLPKKKFIVKEFKEKDQGSFKRCLSTSLLKMFKS